MNRREAITHAAYGALGLALPHGQTIAENGKGIIHITINVGQIPSFKAETYIARWRENWQKDREWVKQQEGHDPLAGYSVIFQPVRPPQKSSIRVFQLDGDDPKEIEPYIFSVFKGRYYPWHDTDVKLKSNECRKFWDYVQLMLGVPVINLKMTKDQFLILFMTCRNDLKNHMDAVRHKTGLPSHYEMDKDAWTHMMQKLCLAQGMMLEGILNKDYEMWDAGTRELQELHCYLENQ